MIRRHPRCTLTTLAAIAATAVVAAPLSTAAAAVPSDRDRAEQLVNLDSSTVVVYADGRVYRRVELGTWASSSGFRGRPVMAPLPPPGAFEWATLSGDAVDDLVERIDDLGLLEPDVDFGDPLITDSPTSTLDLHVGDVEVSHVVYAPGFSDGLTAEQAGHRADYEELRSMLFDLEGTFGDELGDFEPFVPQQWVIGPGFSVVVDTAKPWPLDAEPELGACVVLPSADHADTATGGYRAGEQVVFADAALPGDPRCA